MIRNSVWEESLICFKHEQDGRKKKNHAFSPDLQDCRERQCKNTVGAMTGDTLRMGFEVYHLTLLDYQISSVNATSTVLTSHWEIPAAHDGKRMGILGKVGPV